MSQADLDGFGVTGILTSDSPCLKKNSKSKLEPLRNLLRLVYKLGTIPDGWGFLCFLAIQEFSD